LWPAASSLATRASSAVVLPENIGPQMSSIPASALAVGAVLNRLPPLTAAAPRAASLCGGRSLSRCTPAAAKAPPCRRQLGEGVACRGAVPGPPVTQPQRAPRHSLCPVQTEHPLWEPGLARARLVGEIPRSRAPPPACHVDVSVFLERSALDTECANGLCAAAAAVAASRVLPSRWKGRTVTEAPPLALQLARDGVHRARHRAAVSQRSAVHRGGAVHVSRCHAA
jgi:hypothetical protein